MLTSFGTDYMVRFIWFFSLLIGPVYILTDWFNSKIMTFPSHINEFTKFEGDVDSEDHKPLAHMQALRQKTKVSKRMLHKHIQSLDIEGNLETKQIAD